VTWYDLWLFLHIAGAIVWIGGAATAQVFAVLAKRSGDPTRTAAFGRDISFVGSRIFLPASIVVLVTGVALTEDGGWDWSEPFIGFGIVAWLVVALTAFGYVLREMGKVGAQISVQGPSPALAQRVNRLVLIARVVILVLFVIVLAMVVKPGT
jgi:uncharacterized membrane protein